MDFEIATRKIRAAKHPEDLFGMVVANIEIEYKRLAKIVHPDINHSADALELFKELNRFHEEAILKVRAETYGTFPKATILVKKKEYHVGPQIFTGDITNIFSLDDDNVLKVSRSPANSSMLVNESRMIRMIREKGGTAIQHIPELIASFEINQGGHKHQANVIKRIQHSYTLTEVIKQYPKGLDIRDAAWMFNRLLSAIYASHSAGIIHRAIVPEHVLIVPPNHNGVLIDYCYAGKIGTAINYTIPSQKLFFPPEAELGRFIPNYSFDIYMAAKCLIFLIAGTHLSSEDFDKKLPRIHPIRNLIKACLLSPIHRIQDVLELHDRFDDHLRELYGTRAFRPFVMS